MHVAIRGTMVLLLTCYAAVIVNGDHSHFVRSAGKGGGLRLGPPAALDTAGRHPTHQQQEDRQQNQPRRQQGKHLQTCTNTTCLVTVISLSNQRQNYRRKQNRSLGPYFPQELQRQIIGIQFSNVIYFLFLIHFKRIPRV